MNSREFRAAIDSLPYGKRLPGAVYLIDPGDDPRIPPLLRNTTAELRKRLERGVESRAFVKPSQSRSGQVPAAN